MTFIDKVGDPWHSIELFSVKMIEDKRLGILSISEFARKQANGGEWTVFLRCWRSLRAEISYPADASVLRMAPTMQRGEKVSLDWYVCPGTSCAGVIAAGGLVCFKCCGLLIFASIHDGSLYVPAHPQISGALTGIDARGSDCGSSSRAEGFVC